MATTKASARASGPKLALIGALSLALGVTSALPARAGDQRYEPLAESVQSALTASVAVPSPRLHFEDATTGYRWLFEMSRRLAVRVPDLQTRLDLLKTAHHEALRAGLEPSLVLGLIQVESAFNRYAISHAGARGLMQVMPFWTDLIGSPATNLFHMRTNLRYGCTILRHYLQLERGNLGRALARYNGSLGRSEYPDRVLAASREWVFEPGAGEALARTGSQVMAD
jgi:hypothetical protein